MSGNTILIVEDEVLVARDIQSRLERMGYSVVGTAGRGSEAVQKALSLLPDLILMDINLRDDIDGVEAAIRIRQKASIPVIFCTAYSNDETLERAKISDPYGYVLKPFDNRELEINIEIALYKHRMERDLTETRRRLDATLTNVSDGVIAADAKGEIYFINPIAEQLTGWSAHDMHKPSLPKVLKLEPFTTGQECIDFSDTTRLLEWCNLWDIRQRLVHIDGSTVPVEVNVNRLEGQESELLVITLRDITKQLQYEHTIERNAFIDGLTDLPNRALFVDRLASSINRRKRGSTEPYAVLFLDIDSFGIINEGLGHDMGDKLLTEIGSHIAATVRPDDTVSRFSGDIFAILLEPVDSAAGAITACQRILSALDRPFTLGDTQVNISASVGIVLGQGTAKTPEEMIRDADNALHRAKLDQRGSYCVFDHEMYRSAKRFIDCKAGMQQAMLEGGFEVHYQPIVDIQTEQLVSMEALLRWRHPEEGWVSPAEFIPIAEETGLIQPLGEWVLRTVCQQIAEWRAAGLDHFRVAVNLSTRQFNHELAGLVSSIVRDAGIPASSLGLEITEGVAMKDIERNVAVMQELTDSGFALSIDDFGTGHSSLAYLKKFPIHTLKIDRAFVRDIAEDSGDLEITQAIIALGQSLNLNVLAEGVEERRQVELLRDSGCHYIQGFFYSKPLPAADLLPLLRPGETFSQRSLQLTA